MSDQSFTQIIGQINFSSPFDRTLFLSQLLQGLAPDEQKHMVKISLDATKDGIR